MAKKRSKGKRLAETAATGIAVVLTTLPGAAAQTAPQVTFTGVVTADGRSVTFRASTAQATIEVIGTRTLMHMTASAPAINATFTADLALPSREIPAGVYTLAPFGNAASLEIPGRTADPRERRFALTEGTLFINSYNRAGGTIAGSFSASGATPSGAGTVEFTHGTFFDLPIK